MAGLIPEVWESILQGHKSYGAFGPRDVLIIKSSECLEGPEIVPRKKGELTQEDKDRLSSQGIPSECWDDDAKLMRARRCKEEVRFNIVAVEDGPGMTVLYVLEKITSLLKNTRMPGVIITYFGPGRRNQGDWCFKDGFVTFHDLITLYEKHFTGRELNTISDCSYSGRWVEQVMNYLDDSKISPCAHYARAAGKLLSMIASCRSDEVPYTLYFTARTYRNDKNTGHVYMHDIGGEIADNQHGCCCQNGGLTCGAANFEAPCLMPPTVTWRKTRLAERLFLLRSSTDWGFFLVVDDNAVMDQIRLGQASPMEFGELIKSGYGHEPPAEVKEWVSKEYPGHSCF